MLVRFCVNVFKFKGGSDLESKDKSDLESSKSSSSDSLASPITTIASWQFSVSFLIE